MAQLAQEGPDPETAVREVEWVVVAASICRQYIMDDADCDPFKGKIQKPAFPRDFPHNKIMIARLNAEGLCINPPDDAPPNGVVTHEWLEKRPEGPIIPRRFQRGGSAQHHPAWSR